jgi:hypothetical protein
MVKLELLEVLDAVKEWNLIMWNHFWEVQKENKEIS